MKNKLLNSVDMNVSISEQLPLLSETADPRAIAMTHSAKHGLVRYWSGKITNHILRLLPTL